MAEQSLPLTKRFALFAGLVVVAASMLIIGLYKEMAADDLQDISERSNSAVARVFSNVVWNAHAGFLTTADFLTPEAIRRHPETIAIRQSVLDRMRDLSILKIKIYNLNGLTVFSTEPSQIGEDKSGNDGFLEARLGRLANRLTYRDSFNAFEREVENRDILESYVPITSASGAIEGVLEVYYDVTPLIAAIRQRQLLLQAAVGSTFLVLYLILIFAVWRSEKRTEKHYHKNLDLVRTAAKAEESSRMKSEFLATMSHELRTPLNAILGFSEILKAQMPGTNDEETRREYVDNIWSSGRLLLNIVDDVLDMSKVEAGELTLNTSVFDPIALAESCCRLVENQALAEGIALNAEVAADLPPAFGDERRIKQVLLNLLSNAVKFTPAGGKIMLWVGSDPSGHLLMTVTDTGIGIEADDIKKVLSPFGQVESSYARKFGGTGLGLPIAKSLIEMHGGRFTLESKRDVGTKVSVCLPPLPAAEEERPTDAPLAPVAVLA
ncbi:hypothetical protein HBA54_09080 [Pelagibius litoralis]|uniref:histidine kinase n=1 Tax=Pelagibius litoralis TaxID=374515 RepID=A0A967C8J4_9PROT|nr:ATP-binding protein [Pelagibius litoralis]NIA68742.1 hypothetical protein [Pelagibius litoralis]